MNLFDDQNDDANDKPYVNQKPRDVRRRIVHRLTATRKEYLIDGWR